MYKVRHPHLGRKHPIAAWKEYMSKRQTIPLSLRSSLITTMFTPWGRYRWTRLLFFISSASKERQRQIHTVLDGLLSLGITHGILIPGCGANDMDRPRPQPYRRAWGIWTSCQGECQQDEIPYLQSHLHEPCYHYGWPPAQPYHT